MMLFNATPQERSAAHAAIGAGLSNGTLRPVMGRELPLAEAAAHHAILKDHANKKIVLLP
jgi:NADPH:quinone reductase